MYTRAYGCKRAYTHAHAQAKHQTLNPKQDADDIAAYQITALCMGLVKIKKIGDYQFDMSSDDGVGLYIDDILLLNQTEEVPPLTP